MQEQVPQGTSPLHNPSYKILALLGTSMTCYWRQLFPQPCGLQNPSTGPGSTGGTSGKPALYKGKKLLAARVRNSSVPEFRAAGQELPVACGKPMPVGSAGRTTAVESTQKQRRSMSQMENRGSAMDYFPYIVRFVCKK